MRKGDLKQISYNTAPLRFSDHRPVYATFQCAVSDIDEAKRESLSQEIYAKRRADVGDTTANATNEDIIDDEDLIGYDSIAPELPPASSDRRKWWLDNGALKYALRCIDFSALILYRPPCTLRTRAPNPWVISERKAFTQSIFAYQ